MKADGNGSYRKLTVAELREGIEVGKQFVKEMNEMEEKMVSIRIFETC